MAALHAHAHPAPAPGARDEARIRRWCVLAIAAAVLLAAYAGGIAWVAHRLEASVDRSVQPLPALVHDQPQG